MSVTTGRFDGWILRLGPSWALQATTAGTLQNTNSPEGHERAVRVTKGDLTAGWGETIVYLPSHWQPQESTPSFPPGFSPGSGECLGACGRGGGIWTCLTHHAGQPCRRPGPSCCSRAFLSPRPKRRTWRRTDGSRPPRARPPAAPSLSRKEQGNTHTPGRQIRSFSRAPVTRWSNEQFKAVFIARLHVRLVKTQSRNARLGLITDRLVLCICRRIDCAQGIRSWHSRWNFSSTFTEFTATDAEQRKWRQIDTAGIRIWRHFQLGESWDEISPRAQAPFLLCTTSVATNSFDEPIKYRG